MTDNTDTQDKKPLTMSRPGRLELKKTVETGQIRQSFSHGRSKAVTVEVRKKRTFAPGSGGQMTEMKKKAPELAEPAPSAAAPTQVPQEPRAPAGAPHMLTEGEKAARARALQGAIRAEEQAKQREEELQRQREQEEAMTPPPAPEPEAAPPAVEAAAPAAAPREAPRPAARPAAPRAPAAEAEEEEARAPRKPGVPPKRPGLTPRKEDDRRRGKLTITKALDAAEGAERVRSLAAFRRQKERERRLAHGDSRTEQVKIVRDVTIPETITVQELANRMAERAGEVVKALMKMGVMATINQSIDADTAELVVAEFGHHAKRVAESDVEIGLAGDVDAPETLKPRPPVVTVMGHVDHGKTSLLDALRKTDVASGEAGGITQHIGAYQVTLETGQRITFLDTPGHEAFTAMRARGAKVTDIVVLVVAADDGVMPQTIEAIHHAKAANVPLVVAINKIDKPDAKPERVKNELLQQGIVLEEFGGEVLAIEVSAKQGTNLDKLLEAILLQSEVLELKANPDRSAQGVVVEAKMERGKGTVATVLVQRGTLDVGDIIVAGSEWGRVRALLDDHGRKVKLADPGMPVEVLGLQGTPSAGDDFIEVENEGRAREITEFRQRKSREARAASGARGTVEQMLSAIAAGVAKDLPLVIKADVQGSVEAIVGALEKMSTSEVTARILHSAVGGINESDVTLARASNALVLGFNVRANPQARDLARRDGVEIRYYSIIYDLTNDVKAALGGMLTPSTKESFLGNATIREVFNITKVGKVAGCMVTEGVVRRGAKVRLLRDNVVIHEGSLKSLKRFKDEVREVKEGYECGMAFENYQDIQAGDVIECFEIEQVARTL
ncbi:MAG TPA: translation initiation factor IF-2 [Alphaproteobacteria bacterium]|nr:translation initiation factor IF-2 [Alphaproteobacteria bacterium]